MVLSAMDHSEEVVGDQVGEHCSPELEATLDLARAREALEGVGSFESAELIRIEREGRSSERNSEHGR
jgi:hypothetical protein